jgi:NitT/TauT family transport system substrate-binding protein
VVPRLSVTRNLRSVLCAVAAASLLATAACGSSSASGAAGAKLGSLKLVLGGPPNTSLSLMVFGVAQQLGVWKDQGLNVQVSGLAGQATAAQQLIAGQVQVATVGPETFIQAVSSNQPVGIQAFYTWVRKATWDIVVPANSPVQTLADLKGKTIGVAQIGKSDGKVAQAVIAQAGGESTNDVKLLPVGNGESAVQALKKGQVAAYSDGDASAAQIQALGIPLRTVPLPPEYADASDVTFSATNSYIKSHSKQLVALGIGWAEAVTFCKANEDACVKAFWKQYPVSKPSNADSDFATAAAPFKAVLDARLPKFYADDGKWGETTLNGWLEVAKVYNYQNVDPTKLNAYFTDDLVPQMSKFDAATWQQKAASYK